MAMSTLEQPENGVSPLSAAQIPLPSSTAQSVRGDKPTLSRGAASMTTDATGKAEEKKLQQSWKDLTSAVMEHDEELVKNWIGNIDMVLLFAGLYSAVVTAFIIESYQWLSEDPADTTVALLTKISMQLNASQTQTIFPERPQFEPEASSIRINCFWFLSLILSLTSAFFGLLCKQWLQEHQRDPPTRTPAEALALRQLRRDSLEKWWVPSFLSALPTLLEVALLFFSVGILDLLWNRHPIPFAFCFVTVALGAVLYTFTTFLPTLVLFFRMPSPVAYQSVCPYKSPHAWAVYHLLIKTLRVLWRVPSIRSYILRWSRGLTNHVFEPASDWSSLDFDVIRQLSAELSNSFTFNVYELRAFQWACATFRDSPSMLPHLQNVLGTIHPSVPMSVVLGDRSLTIWGNIQKSDLELWFHDRQAFKKSLDWDVDAAPQPNLRDPILLHPEGIKLLSLVQGITSLTDTLEHGWVETIESHQADLQQLMNLRFVIPFTVIETLWTHHDPNIQKRSSRLLRFFGKAFDTPEGYNEKRHDGECLAFVYTLMRHLNHTDFTSYVATSIRGQEFIHFVHDQIISRRLLEPHRSWETDERRELMLAWSRVTRRVTEMGRWPTDYSSIISEFSEDPTDQLTDAIPFLSIDPYQIEDENGVPQSNHELNDNGQGGVPRLVTQGEQGDEVGGVGADERV
ncbi:hypothetical protein WG66_000950 [Moniliophthora roreri]|nr:hypothetical protein WG66_000950 [Moniliophthora roreri]